MSEGRGIKAMLASCMILGAVLVIVTCVWKIVKLIARFKMEERIEEMEAQSIKSGATAPGEMPNVVCNKQILFNVPESYFMLMHAVRNAQKVLVVI